MKRVVSFLCSLALLCSCGFPGAGVLTSYADHAEEQPNVSTSIAEEAIQEVVTENPEEEVQQQIPESDSMNAPEFTPVPEQREAELPAEVCEITATEGSTVEQIFEERSPSSMLLTCGTLATGGEVDLSFRDGKTMTLEAALQPEGGYKAEAEFAFVLAILPGDLSEGTVRLSLSGADTNIAQNISVYNWDSSEYEEINTETSAEERDLDLPLPVSAYLSEQGQVKVRVAFTGADGF